MLRRGLPTNQHPKAEIRASLLLQAAKNRMINNALGRISR